MAIISREPTFPDVQASYANLGALTSAETVRSSLDNKMETNYVATQSAIALLESLQTHIGNGAISGGTISAGTGLSVDIAAFEAFLGTIVGNDATTTVGGLAANDVNYIFATQSGTFLTDPDPNAIPLGSYGAYMLWGTATTDGTGVTAVSNDRRHVQKPGHLSKSVAGSADVTLTSAEAVNRQLEFTGILTGNIKVYVPLWDGSEWVAINSTTGAFTLTVIGTTGTGIVVGSGKTALLRGNGTNIYRMTADV